MSGLEGIINKIKEDSKKTCDKLIEAANNEAKSALLEATKQGNAQKEKVELNGQNEVNLIFEKGKMSAKRLAETIILSKKNEYINEIIEKGEQEFLNRPDYKDFIIKSALKEAQSGCGIISLNERDLKKFGTDLERKLNDALKSTDKKVSLSKDPVKIKGGFILNYETTVINASIEEIINSKRDEIKDEINKILFN